MRRLITIAAMLAAGLATAQEHQRVAVETTTRKVSVSAGNTAGHMPESLYSSCVAWLDFGRNNGTTYYDCSRSANNGTATNAATQPAWTNANGGALVFDGVNDNVSLGRIADMESKSNVTVAAWVNRSALADYKGIFTKGNLAAESHQLIFSGAALGGNDDLFARATVDATDRYGYTTDSCVGNTNAWYHVALVFNGAGADNAGRMQVYVNATNRSLTFGGGAIGTTATASTLSAYLGRYQTDANVPSMRCGGLVVTAGNGAQYSWTAPQVTNHYNATKGAYGL